MWFYEMASFTSTSTPMLNDITPIYEHKALLICNGIVLYGRFAFTGFGAIKRLEAEGLRVPYLFCTIDLDLYTLYTERGHCFFYSIEQLHKRFIYR